MYQVTTRQISPFQVEFPKTKKVDGKKESVKFGRTKDGALHFRPGTVVLLSVDEYEFLKRDRNLNKKFVFQGEVKELPKRASKSPELRTPKEETTKAKKKKS